MRVWKVFVSYEWQALAMSCAFAAGGVFAVGVDVACVNVGRFGENRRVACKGDRGVLVTWVASVLGVRCFFLIGEGKDSLPSCVVTSFSAWADSNVFARRLRRISSKAA